MILQIKLIVESLVLPPPKHSIVLLNLKTFLIDFTQLPDNYEHVIVDVAH